MIDPGGHDLWHWLLSPSAQTAVAGALGGIVRWLTLQEHWRQGILSLLVGAICAIYLGPLAEPMLAPVVGRITPNGDADGFASFVVGLGGISISSFVIDLMRRSHDRVRLTKSQVRKLREDHDDES